MSELAKIEDAPAPVMSETTALISMIERAAFAKALLAILFRIDAADRRQDQLHLTIVEAAATLNAHELTRVKFVLESIGIRHHLGDDLCGRVLKREEEKVAAAAAGANLLVGAEKESPP